MLVNREPPPLVAADGNFPPSDAAAPDPCPESPRRGRKSGQVSSLTAKVEARRAKLEQARAELKALAREAEARRERIVGAALLDAAESDPDFRAVLVARLRAAPLSAASRAEIASLLVDQD